MGDDGHSPDNDPKSDCDGHGKQRFPPLLSEAFKNVLCEGLINFDSSSIII